MAKRGTTAKIDLGELEKLCGLQCTDEEIGAWFGVTTRTIERRRKVKKFAEVMERGKAKGRISVRRMQMKLLEQGNATMGVWLGKNILGQVDEIRHELFGNISTSLQIVVPRDLDACRATGPSVQLIDVGKDQVAIESANYETVVDHE